LREGRDSAECSGNEGSGGDKSSKDLRKLAEGIRDLSY